MKQSTLYFRIDVCRVSLGVNIGRAKLSNKDNEQEEDSFALLSVPSATHKLGSAERAFAMWTELHVSRNNRAQTALSLLTSMETTRWICALCCLTL